MNRLQNIEEKVRPLKVQAKTFARRRTILHKGIQLAAMGFFPLCESLYFGVYSGDTIFHLSHNALNVWDVLFIVVLISHGAAIVYLLLLSGAIDVEDYIFQVDELQEELDKTSVVNTAYAKENQNFVIYIDIIQNISSRVSQFLANPSFLDDYTLDSLLEDLLDEFDYIIPSLFDYPKTVYYNFSIYIYDQKSHKLHCRFRARDQVLEKLKPGESRSWKTGQGHIGKCFSNDKSFIDPDITKDVSFPAGERDNDSQFYRSVICVTLRKCEIHQNDHAPKIYGVMILTSSIPDHFSSLHLRMMRTLKFTLEELIGKVSEQEEALDEHK